MNKMWLWNTNANGGRIVQIGYFQYTCHDQGHKVIDPGVIWKGFISWESMPHMSFYILQFKSYGQGKSFWKNTHRQTGQKLDALKLHSGA